MREPSPLARSALLGWWRIRGESGGEGRVVAGNDGLALGARRLHRSLSWTSRLTGGSRVFILDP